MYVFTCTLACVWRSEDNLRKLVLSFYCVGVRTDDKPLKPNWSHLL